MTKITKVNKKRITTTIMGYYIKKQSTMVDRVSKAFAGGPGGQFSRKEPPWPPEVKKNGPIGKSTNGYSGFLQPVVF